MSALSLLDVLAIGDMAGEVARHLAPRDAAALLLVSRQLYWPDAARDAYWRCYLTLAPLVCEGCGRTPLGPDALLVAASDDGECRCGHVEVPRGTLLLYHSRKCYQKQCYWGVSLRERCMTVETECGHCGRRLVGDVAICVYNRPRDETRMPKRKRAAPAVVAAALDTGPFWNAAVANMGKHLVLPTGQGPKPNVLPHAWFHTPVTPGQTPARVVTIDDDALDQWLQTSEGGLSQVSATTHLSKKQRTAQTKGVAASSLKTRKIRVYPANRTHAQKLRQMFGTARWTYNECLKRVKAEEYLPSRVGGLREAVLHDSNYTDASNAWVTQTPYTIRQGAMEDLIKAYASNYAKLALAKPEDKHRFELKFRSRYDPQQSLYISKRCYQNGGIYVKTLGKQPFSAREALPSRLAYDARLIYTRQGEYYLCYTTPTHAKRDESQVPPTARMRVAAIDPGVRTPHTLYEAATGQVIEFGKGALGRLHYHCYHLDQLRSRIDQLPRRIADTAEKRRVHRQRWRMRRAWHRASQRLRNLVEEYHRQVVHYLVTHYDLVLLPALRTSQLVKRALRKLTSKSVRAMLTWSHYRFRQRLLWKVAQQQPTGCKVLVCDEAYTSKTCGACGRLHPALGKSKLFVCPHCHVTMDRDVNGARNILLKHTGRLGLRVEAELGLPLRRGLACDGHGPRGLALDTRPT